MTHKALGKWLNRSQFAMGQWIDLYRTKGLHNLLHLNDWSGNLAPSIPLEIQGQLKEKLAQPDGIMSYKAIQIWLKEIHGLDMPYSAVFGTVKYRLNACLIPRPYTENYDQEAVDDVKKNVSTCLGEILTPCLNRYSRIRYWMQDESCFGLNTRRRITLKKVKSIIKVQWSF